MQYLDAISKKDKMISVYFQGKSFNIMVMQVYAPTRNAEEAEVEWFYKDLQDLLELTPKKSLGTPNLLKRSLVFPILLLASISLH